MQNFRIVYFLTVYENLEVIEKFYNLLIRNTNHVLLVHVDAKVETRLVHVS